ncbi:protein phosphatase 2C domain-containing protein [bacterium]|nr:protein phosphatase 2C domain-containing protein [bacterium]MBR0192551.1 protein phosphatase 2C domain-containing protein [Thermoguttaceae bacterium]
MLDYRMTYSSVCGKSHKKDNTPCEDACFGDTRDGLAAICVCDGAGSKKFSRFGSQIAAKTTVSFLLKNYSDYREAVNHGKEKLLHQKLIEEIISKFREHLEGQCKEFGTMIRSSAFEFSSRNSGVYSEIKERLKSEFEVSFKSCVETWSPNTLINTKLVEILPAKTRRFWNDEFYKKTAGQWNNLLKLCKDEIDKLPFLNPEEEIRVLEEITSPNERYIEEYACTIVALVVTQEGDWLSIHIGDGGIVGRTLNLDQNLDQKQNLFLISGPENGEFASTTWFITNDDALERIRINFNKSDSERIDSALLFSDGPEGCLLKANKPKECCNDILEEILQNGFSFEKAQACLEEQIKNIPKYIDDDCTIGIIKGFNINTVLPETGKPQSSIEELPGGLKYPSDHSPNGAEPDKLVMASTRQKDAAPSPSANHKKISKRVVLNMVLGFLVVFIVLLDLLMLRSGANKKVPEGLMSPEFQSFFNNQWECQQPLILSEPGEYKSLVLSGTDRCLFYPIGPRHYFYRKFEVRYEQDGLHCIFNDNDKRVFDQQGNELDPDNTIVTFLQSLKEIRVLTVHKDYCIVKISGKDGYIKIDNSEDFRFTPLN